MADETTLEEDFRKDSEFLETLAAWFEKEPGTDPKDAAQCAEIAAELRSIAVGVGEIALNRRRMVALEDRVDDKLCELAEGWLKGDTSEYAMGAAALWLCSRRLQSMGTKSLIGGGLGGIGAAAIASMFRSSPGEGPKGEEG
jgi:hypothetical protein